jgi:hypothetical protein
LKLLFFAALFLLSFALSAQDPTPVPLKGEPHHHLVLENEFVRAFYVEVAPHDATLLHQHDADYVFVVLGPGDFVNAVAGKPEVHVTLEDATTRFSRGGFAHVARTDAGIPFRNVTVELLRPQGVLRNLCQKVTDGPVNDCPDSPPPSMKPLFETDEIVVFSGALGTQSEQTVVAPHAAALILALENSNINVNVGGDVKAQLHSGQVFWFPAGQKHTISCRGGACRFVLVSFKDSAPR